MAFFKEPTEPAPTPKLSAATVPVETPAMVSVNCKKLDEMLIALLHGHHNLLTGSAVTSHVMQLFNLKTRDEALAMVRVIQERNRERKANAT